MYFYANPTSVDLINHNFIPWLILIKNNLNPFKQPKVCQPLYAHITRTSKGGFICSRDGEIFSPVFHRLTQKPSGLLEKSP